MAWRTMLCGVVDVRVYETPQEIFALCIFFFRKSNQTSCVSRNFHETEVGAEPSSPLVELKLEVLVAAEPHCRQEKRSKPASGGLIEVRSARRAVRTHPLLSSTTLLLSQHIFN